MSGADLPPGDNLSDKMVMVALALILAAIFVAYANTLGFQFVHDDRSQVLGNTWLRSWKYLPRYFTADVWAFERPAFRGNFYRPIFLLWYRLQYIAFGLKPWGWHLCTILCHLIVTLLVYFTAVRLIKDKVAALFATLIFGLHPTHAEAVAWVAGVTEPLFAIFLFASYLYYLKRRAEPARAQANLVTSLIFYGVACFAKETAVILPAIIFACEYIWADRKQPAQWRDWVRRCWNAALAACPYVALFAFYLVARIISLHGFQNPREEHSYLDMVLTWPSALSFYIQHLLWPWPLIPFYNREFYSHVDLRHVIFPAIIVLLAGAALWIWGKRSTEAAVATVWMVLPILPVLNLRAFIEGHLVHDRYLYLPSFGFAMLVAMGIRQIKFGRGRLFGLPAVQVELAVLLALAMGLGIIKGTACYANETTYFTYVTSMSREGHGSNLDVAGLLGNKGHVDEAIKILDDIVRTQPDNWDVNYNLGYAYYLTGKLPEADKYLGRAVVMDDTRPDAFFYLGLTKLKMGDVNAAAANVQRAIMIRPDTVHYHFAMGVIFRLQGNMAGALSEFQQEMDIDPDNTSARLQAAEVAAAIGAQRPAESGSAPNLPNAGIR